MYVVTHAKCRCESVDLLSWLSARVTMLSVLIEANIYLSGTSHSCRTRCLTSKLCVRYQRIFIYQFNLF